MKTLLQLLKPKFQKQLNKERKNFPTSISQLESRLHNNYSTRDLTIGEASELLSFLDPCIELEDICKIFIKVV